MQSSNATFNKPQSSSRQGGGNSLIMGGAVSPQPIIQGNFDANNTANKLINDN